MAGLRRPVLALLFAAFAAAAPVHIDTPKEALGFNPGDDYMVAGYSQLEAYWKKLAAQSDRVKLVDIGATTEGRRQLMAIVSSPENLKRLDHYREIARRLALAQNLTDEQARALAREGKAVVWIDGGLHSSETVGSTQLIEMLYQMTSRSDPETLRLLDDTIELYVPANPDGQEMVATWYMRERDPLKRSLANLPALYSKYAGHDDNRDFYASNLAETTNMNRQMFLEWFPQIVYDHHQTGPRGAVVFMPPFRDPFNYNLDPLIPLGIDMVGAAMHSRLVEEGKGGSAMRGASNYSTWWNGGLRTIAYFHNMIGILTEIIGNPTPIQIPLVADRQLATGDLPLPVAPQPWHYRQSIEYDISNNRAVLDYASRYRETLLYNIYKMGCDSIEAGSRDHWTVTPKRIEALRADLVDQARATDAYNRVLHDPAFRDPRGYILPSDQPDFATAAKFVASLRKTGVEVLKATAPFRVAGRNYPAGSYVVKTAQAFRPQVLDMFEPQDYPNDFAYPGAPPTPPYDITGWTLALQMGVQYDRVLEAFDGPFTPVTDAPVGTVTGPANPAGYLISHRENNSFLLVNRLLKAGCDVYWLKDSPEPGEIWVPASRAAASVIAKSAAEFGGEVRGVSQPPSGAALKLRPPRIGLYDEYRGLTASGWTRWTLDQFEFPYQTVYPQTLDAGDLRKRFDVLVFPGGALRDREGRPSQPRPDQIPAEYRNRLGAISPDRTAPQLRQFVEAGGSLVAVGGSSALGAMLGIPVEDSVHGLAPEKLYVPGSLLRVTVDNSDPLAYGMPAEADVFFDNDPVFKPAPGAVAIAKFAAPPVLASGWAWGQQYLDGGAAVVEAPLGMGKVFLMAPDVTFRGQSHGTFKLLFNALDYAAAQPATLP